MEGIKDVLFSGGVSSSRTVKKILGEMCEKESDCGLGIYFGDPALSSDNAVGTALLGGKTIWRQNL